jgi:hypothetical protein
MKLLNEKPTLLLIIFWKFERNWEEGWTSKLKIIFALRPFQWTGLVQLLFRSKGLFCLGDSDEKFQDKEFSDGEFSKSPTRRMFRQRKFSGRKIILGEESYLAKNQAKNFLKNNFSAEIFPTKNFPTNNFWTNVRQRNGIIVIEKLMH